MRDKPLGRPRPSDPRQPGKSVKWFWTMSHLGKLAGGGSVGGVSRLPVVVVSAARRNPDGKRGSLMMRRDASSRLI